MQPFHGFGLGLRQPHYHDFMQGTAAADFVEIISENFMVEGGRPLAVIDAVREHYPVAMHGVSLSVGSAGGVDPDYLARLKQLADRIQPLWISDHLCWTRTHAHNSHDLLPLPYTFEALDLVCANLSRAQDALGREMLLENPSSYCQLPGNALTEWEFLGEVARRTGCHLLLDVNNVYVSACNHGFDAQQFLAGLPMDRVRQIHLAGHTPGNILIDTHDRAVAADVWALYASALALAGPVATMIERDDAIPPLGELIDELAAARTIAAASERRAA